jgi:3-mercaptopyruvate sulfurtransferase SseA
VESTGHIAGSIHIPVRDLLKNLDKLPGQDEKIVVTCASGHRGAFSMLAVCLLGHTDVVNLGGGIGAWSKATLPREPGLPAEAAVLGAPEADAAHLAALEAYFSSPTEGFGTVKAPDLSTEIAGSTAPFILAVRTEAEKTADG